MDLAALVIDSEVRGALDVYVLWEHLIKVVREGAPQSSNGSGQGTSPRRVDRLTPNRSRSMVSTSPSRSRSMAISLCASANPRGLAHAAP